MINDIIVSFYRNDRTSDAKELVCQLIKCNPMEIRALMLDLDQKKVTTYNIPQYSSFDDGSIRLIEYLRMAGDFGPSFVEVGQHFLDIGHSEVAYTKYGENHSKLGELLGLVEIIKKDRKRVFLTDLGREVEKLDKEKQRVCLAKLSARIPIVQEAMKKDICDIDKLEQLLNIYLSAATALRRRRNTWDLIVLAQGCEK